MLKLFLAEQLRQFCNTTGIRGFTFASHSKSRLELALWSCALAVGTVMTVFETVETIRLYSSEPTMTKLIMKGQRPLNLSHLSVCLGYSRDMWKFSGLKEENLVRENITDYFQSQIKRVLSNPGNKSALNLEELKILFSTVSYLERLFREESPFRTFELTSNETNSLVRNITNTPELINAVGNLLWCLGNLSIRQYVEAEGPPIRQGCESFQLGWLGPEPFSLSADFCFAVDPTMLSFATPSAYLSLRFDSSQFFEKPFQEMAVMFGSDHCVNSETENNLVLERHSQNIIDIRIDGVYKSLYTAANPCSNVSILNCTMGCYNNAMFLLFNCMPLLSVFGKASSNFNDKFCAKNRSVCIYHNVTCFEQQKILLTKCRKSCKLPCENTVFSLSTNQADSDADPNYVYILLLINSFVHPIFEETLSIGLRQFLAQVGGNLSLWIGSSFLVLLHIIVYIIRMPFLYLDNMETHSSTYKTCTCGFKS